MLRLSRLQIQPIGLDIGRDSIKMLQLEVADGVLSVKAAARRSLPDSAKSDALLHMPVAADMIRQMLHEGGFVGRRSVMALPRESVHVKNFRLPLMPPSELEAAVQFEARHLFPFETDQARVHFVPAGEVRQGNDVLQEIIALAVSNEDADNFVEQMHRSGLIIDSFDVQPLALFRSVERFIRRREDEQEAHVLVDVGLRSSQVVIGIGREISFLKSIDIGGLHFRRAISERLGITMSEAAALRRRLIEAQEGADAVADRDPVRQAVFDATRSVMEQLGREISLCLRYQSVTFRGHRPQRLRLLGGEAADTQLQELLKAMLTIPVEAGRPLYSVDTSRMKVADRRGLMAEWAVALGLGLRHTVDRFGRRDGRSRGSAPAGADPAATVDGEAQSPGAVSSVEVAAPPAGAAIQEAVHARA